MPTIWLDLLRYADEHEPDLSSIRMVVCGGAAVPLSLMQAFEERHGVRIIQAWGMTETSPLALGRAPAGRRRGRGALGLPRDGRAAAAARRGAHRRRRRRRACRGTASRPASSRCAARGSPASYYERPGRAPRSSTTAGCAPATSPRSTTRGYIRITDRAKDVIKSGGEWISSVELENELMAHPTRRRGGGDRHARRALDRAPAGLRRARARAQASRADGAARRTSRARVAKWWLPDEFAFIDEVPKTSVGKFDKKVLRKRLAEGELETVSESEPASRSA